MIYKYIYMYENDIFEILRRRVFKILSKVLKEVDASLRGKLSK